jgi:hypothetical protein
MKYGNGHNQRAQPQHPTVLHLYMLQISVSFALQVNITTLAWKQHGNKSANNGG